ncbi:hypothetical protein BDV93DRAFT_611061 [Ceratobasidium sp. AG-I]|nr:hypothetical protein BDV93DRAFT_611061 [Ceratobasidium sp. AG-I]
MGKRKARAEAISVTLGKQYPSADPSLIAALLSDIDPTDQAQLTELRSTLATLCPTSDNVNNISCALERTSLTSSGSASDPFNDSSSSHPTTITSSSSATSLASFSTPLGFLQNLFPHLESSVLQSSLDEHGVENLDTIVDTLLSDDYIREMQERDSWSDIDLSTDPTLVPDTIEQWNIPPEPQRASTLPTSPAPARRKQKGKSKQATIVIGDVRHRHLASPRSGSRTASGPTIDPWTYIDSLATRLNAILPNISTTVFSSAFHNPNHPTPAAALRSTLASLGNTNTVDDFALAALICLLDASPDDIPDANLCLKATASQPDDAYSLLEILREIDDHLPVIAHAPSSPITSTAKRVPAAPPDTPPPVTIKRAPMLSPIKALNSPPTSPARPAWGTVPLKVKPRSASYSQVSYVPGSSAWARAGGNGVEHESGVDERDTGACLEEAAYWKNKRHETLKQASELFTRHKHEHGREGALYYSQKAQEYATKEKEWRMKAAKASVRTKQERTSSKAIDLHGLTVHESLEIVKEGVNTWWSSAGAGSTPSTPLEIITGLGKHSKGNVPVIAPAVLKYLERHGWKSYKREGTVYVTGVVGRR